MKWPGLKMSCLLNVDLMIITDECMKRSMHLWSVNNQITYRICPFWGWSWISLPLIAQNSPRQQFICRESLLQAPLGVRTGTRLLARCTSYIWEVKCSYRKQLWRTLSVAVLCLRVSVGVLMLNTLWRGPTLGQAQLKVILHSSEEILETFSCTIQEALKERLLIGLEAARHAILINATAAVGQAAFTNVLSGAGSIDVTAAVNQQVFSLADVTKFVCEQRLALDGVSALSDLSAAVAEVETDFPGDAMVRISNL